MAKAYLTSDDLIESVKRKISFPIAQNTFSEEDILAFASEELMISQVPSVLQFHQEYFVFSEDVPLLSNVTRYEIPERAIGMKLRDLFYKDTNGNLFDMTRIAEDDKAFFQRSMGTYQTISKYYLEGNYIVLSPDNVSEPTGSLLFTYFLRPNVLVKNNRAAIISAFCKTLTVNNATLADGDTVKINSTTFIARTGSPSSSLEFQIGVLSADTATNLTSAIVNSGVVMAASANAAIVTVQYSDIVNTTILSSNSAGITVQQTQGVMFQSIPDNILSNTYIDFLQTKPGHSMRRFGVLIPNNGVSSNIINFNANDVPLTLVLGDYVATENESIIPQIPPDLHSGLAERTCARILAAIGDQAGLQASNAKIAEIEQRQGTLLDSRVEGSNIKVRSRNSLLSMGKMSYRRRW